MGRVRSYIETFEPRCGERFTPKEENFRGGFAAGIYGYTKKSQMVEYWVGGQFYCEGIELFLLQYEPELKP